MALQDIGARLVLEGLSAYTSGMGSAKSANEGVTKSAKDLGDASNTTADKLGGLLKVGAAAAAAAMAALGGEMYVAVKAAQESQVVHAQLAAVLESTGGAAGVTSEMANELADSLSKLSGADDEAVLGAENMLLTFTSIGSDVFPDVSKAVVNMATAMNGGAIPSAQQLRDTAIQVGKAMQDPITGATALRRVGVQLTEAQQEQIKSLMALGDQEGAQKIILAELANEFGSAAEAAGNTFAGKLGRLQTQLGNVQETIGGALLPVLTELASKAADWVEGAIPQVETFLGQMGLVKDAIAALLSGQGFDVLYDQINKTFGPDTAKLLGDIIDAIAVFSRDELPKLISAFNDLKGAATPVLDMLGTLAKEAIPLIGDGIKKVIDVGSGLVKFFHDNELAADALASVLAAGVAIQLGITAVALYGVATAAVAAAIPMIALALPFIALGVVIAAVILAGVEIVKNWGLIELGARALAIVVQQAWDNITGAIGSAVAAIGDAWNGLMGALDLLQSHFIEILGFLVGSLVRWAGDAVAAIGQFVSDFPGQVLGAASAAQESINTFIDGAVSALAGWAGDAVAAIAGFVTGLPQGVSDAGSGALEALGQFVSDGVAALEGAVGDFLGAGADMVWGVINGITQTIPNALGAIGNAVSQFVGAFKAGLGISSPSRVMATEVGQPMVEGIAQGITDGAPVVVTAISSVVSSAMSTMDAQVKAEWSNTDRQEAWQRAMLGGITLSEYKAQFQAATIEIASATPNGPTQASILAGQENAMYGSGGIIAQIAALPGVAASRMITADLLPQIQDIIASVNKSKGQNFSLETTLHDLYFDGYGLDKTLTDLWQGAGSYAVGGAVPGAPGTPVPIVAHAGELILNLSQQDHLAKAYASLMSAPGTIASRPQVTMLPLGEVSRAPERANVTYKVDAHYSRWQDEATLRTDLEAISLLASR